MDTELLLKNKKLTDTEKEVLDFIITNIDSLEGIGVREIALKHYTSPAAIVRMAKKLGFTGYVELYHFIKNDKKYSNQKNQFSIVDYQINESILIEDSKKIKQIYESSNQKLILIYATGFSGIAGEYLSKKLLVNGIRVIYLSEKDSVAIIENNVKNISMFIGISKSGQTDRLIEKIKYLKEKNIPIILFTGNQESEAAKLSNTTFIVEDDRKMDGQNKNFNSFFGKLLLVLEYFVYNFLK